MAVDGVHENPGFWKYGILGKLNFEKIIKYAKIWPPKNEEKPFNLPNKNPLFVWLGIRPDITIKKSEWESTFIRIRKPRMTIFLPDTHPFMTNGESLMTSFWLTF